jgi:hypothetical protein
LIGEDTRTKVDAAPHTDPGGGTVNPHRLVYRLPLPRGTRAELARTDRAIVARLRMEERDHDTVSMRINLAESVGDGWGSLSSRAIDGIPGDGRMFGPVRGHLPDGMAVDAAYRATVLSRAVTRIARAALTATSWSAAEALTDAAVAADHARARQHAEYECHAERAYRARLAARYAEVR